MMLLVLATLVVSLALGLLMRVSRVSEFYAGTGELNPAVNGLAIAAAAMAGALIFGLAEGKDDLAIFTGLFGGLLLIALLLAPALQRFGGYTLPDFLAERFGGGDARVVGIVAIIGTSVPLLVAALWVAGLMTAQTFGIGLGSGILIVSAILLVATLPGGMRSLSLLEVGLGVVLILLVGIVAIGVGVLASPHDGRVAPLVGVRSPKDWDESTALAVTLALGTAVLPHLLMRSICVNSPQAARFSFAWALLFLIPLSFAPRAFRAGLSLAGGEGPFLASGPLAALGGAALLAASLAVASGLAFAIANILSYDIYYKSLAPGAAPFRRLVAARIGFALVLVVAGWIAGHAGPESLRVAASCLSLAASVLLPALALGLWWGRANGQGASAGMVAGLAVCLYYLLAPRYIPITFYETSSLLSNATPEDAARYLLLKKAALLAGGAARAWAFAAWEEKARALANWGGVDRACAALFAVPAGFLVTIMVSLVTPAPAADVQRAVAGLGAPAKERTT
jgi:cation/acetate symporter